MDFTSITQFDLWLMPIMGGAHSPMLDQFALILTSGWTWVVMYIVMLFIVIKNNETMGQILLAVLSVAFLMLLSDGMADGVVKPICQRLRPINDPDVRPMLEIVSGISSKTYSFFSAHAANTFALCTFFSLLTRSLWATGGLMLWAMINCWTRVYLGMHYPSDIFVGMLWGIVSGVLAYIGYKTIYNRISPKLHFISSQYTSSGYAFSDIYLLLNTMLLTIVYAIFRSLLNV